MKSPTTLAQTLRSTRKSKRWSQGILSKNSRVSIRTIVDIEGGKQLNPRIDVVIRLAHALGENIDNWLKLANHSDEKITEDMISHALEGGSAKPQGLGGSETVAKVEDLKFLETLMVQTTDRPLTFRDLYELLCRFRARK